MTAAEWHYILLKLRRNLDLHDVKFNCENPQKGQSASSLEMILLQKFLYKAIRKIILPNTTWPVQNLCPDPLV